MHVVAGLLGLGLALTMLGELFVTLLLPRRVKRDVRFARQIYVLVWPAWRRIGARFDGRSRETFLGFFGPLGFVGVLTLWGIGLVLGFSLMHWGAGSHLGPHRGFDDDLYFSAADFLTAGAGSLSPTTGLEKLLAVLGTASGFGLLTTVIAYLPALFGAFSRRETAVSQLDPRAGSPPNAARLIVRSTGAGDWTTLSGYLGEWENWAAELMETHLSYPVLAYYRSQHVNQNWLAALTTILDASAFTVAAAPLEEADGARFTFALGRHAIVDLAYTFRASASPPPEDRLPSEEFGSLLDVLIENGVSIRGDSGEVEERLRRMRNSYEPYAVALSARLELTLPAWGAAEGAVDNWRVEEFH